MPSFDLEINGLDKLAKDLSVAKGKPKDLRSLFEDAYENSFTPEMADTFQDEGPGWKPLSAQWLRFKREGGYPTSIGQFTQALRRSLATKARTQGTIRRISKQEATFGTSLEHAAYFDAERPIFSNRTLTRLSGYLSENIARHIMKPLEARG